MNTCDYCKKKPVANYQRVWVRWEIKHGCEYADEPDYDGAGELNEMDEPVDENNIHVCAKHEEKLLNGELDW